MINSSNNKIRKILSILIGIIFLFSSVSKAIDIETFGYLLMAYGNKKLIFLAPLITAIEFFIGLGYILQIFLKNIVLLSFWLTLFLTVIYIYGFVYLNIEDCGCFGNILKLNPFITLAKNCILLALMYFISFKSTSVRKGIVKQSVTILFSLILFSINCVEIINFQNFNNVFVGQRLQISNSNIKEGKQIWFIFNPNCNHCQKITPKLLESKTPVIGIYSEKIKLIKIDNFSKKYKIDFQLLPVKDSILYSLTYRYPLIITTEGGIVKSILTDL